MSETNAENTAPEQKKVIGRPFSPGVSGNPAGKPKGAKHLTTLLFQALQKKIPGKDETYQDKLVERILTEAIVKGKGDQIKMIMNYVDGMPEQGIDVTTNGESVNSASSIDIMEIAKKVSADLKIKKTR